MATFKATPAISISRVAEYLAKTVGVKSIASAKTLPALKEALREHRHEFVIDIPGLDEGTEVMVERCNVRAMMCNLSLKSSLVNSVLELDSDLCPLGDVSSPLILCDDTLTGIESIFLLYEHICNSRWDTHKWFLELYEQIEAACEAVPVMCTGSLDLGPSRHGLEDRQWLMLAAVQLTSFKR